MTFGDVNPSDAASGQSLPVVSEPKVVWALGYSPPAPPLSVVQVQLDDANTKFTKGTQQLAQNDDKLDTDLEAIRKTADGWLKTSTALLSLFSLASLIFNKDVLARFLGNEQGFAGSQGAVIFFCFLAGLTVVAGMVSIAFGTFAAQGWPVGCHFGSATVSVRSRAKAIKKAISGLIFSVSLAALSVLSLIGAIVVVYYPMTQ